MSDGDLARVLLRKQRHLFCCLPFGNNDGQSRLVLPLAMLLKGASQAKMINEATLTSNTRKLNALFPFFAKMKRTK
jgi:hypothetical protein